MQLIRFYWTYFLPWSLLSNPFSHRFHEVHLNRPELPRNQGQTISCALNVVAVVYCLLLTSWIFAKNADPSDVYFVISLTRIFPHPRSLKSQDLSIAFPFAWSFKVGFCWSCFQQSALWILHHVWFSLLFTFVGEIVLWVVHGYQCFSCLCSYGSWFSCAHLPCLRSPQARRPCSSSNAVGGDLTLGRETVASLNDSVRLNSSYANILLVLITCYSIKATWWTLY